MEVRKEEVGDGRIKIVGNCMSTREQMDEQRQTRDKKRKEIPFTFCSALCGVGDVVQGDVRPHVSAGLRLEGHSERSRVGQDDIGVFPLVAVVPSGCPHQQTGATGSNSEDLGRREPTGMLKVT